MYPATISNPRGLPEMRVNPNLKPLDLSIPSQEQSHFNNQPNNNYQLIKIPSNTEFNQKCETDQIEIDQPRPGSSSTLEPLPVKTIRPFKAYCNNSASLVLPMVYENNTEVIDNSSARNYNFIRRTLLSKCTRARSVTNVNMRRSPISQNSEKYKDPNYLEKRRKNNEAAKKSRDARKAKEDEIALRCMLLQDENMYLKLQIRDLKYRIQALTNSF